MTDDFKKWCSEKADYKVPMVYISRFNEKPLVTLIKAMWNINREGIYEIIIDNHVVTIMSNTHAIIDFEFKHHNNSEQESLQKALEYIYKREQT